MNTISTKSLVNEFSGNNYYIITIDGKSLEDIVIDENPSILKGLVPTLLNWLVIKEERDLVWGRVLPSLGEKSNLPILICSDDIDLYCTLIIVEVEINEEYVYWNKLGLENGTNNNLNTIGNNVTWFDNIKQMKFKKEDYKNVLNKFKVYLDSTIKEPYQ